MEPSKAQNEPPAPDDGKRGGGTLLRFKKLTNHLFGRSEPDEDAAAGKDEKKD